MDSVSTDQLEIENRKLKEEIALIKEKALRYELLFELSDDAILVIENDKFIDCNKAVVKMLGYENKNQFLNTHPSELSPERQPDGRLSYDKAQEMNALALSKGSHHFEWIHTKANGEDFPVEVWLSSVKYMDKLLINTIWRNLTEIKKAEDKLKKSLKEKETLLQELHHRVKNNLQIIISLIRLQSQSADNIELSRTFKALEHKVQSIGMVHHLLYQSNEYEFINTKEYIENLVHGFKKSIFVNSSIEFEVNVEAVMLNINKAIPLGLIITELITNSLKHAFLNEENGKINIDFSKSNGSLKIIVKDNGSGINSEINSLDINGIGLELVEDLVKQLNGTISRKNKFGISYTILIK